MQFIIGRTANFFNSLHLSGFSLEREKKSQIFRDMMCEDLYMYVYIIIIMECRFKDSDVL